MDGSADYVQCGGPSTVYRVKVGRITVDRTILLHYNCGQSHGSRRIKVNSILYCSCMVSRDFIADVLNQSQVQTWFQIDI